MKFKIKNKYKGKACIREMTVHECKESGEDLTVLVGEESMIIPNNKLYDYDYKIRVPDRLKIKEGIKEASYELFYYKWDKFKCS